MDHYKNMMSALGGAMPKCMVWQRMDDDKEKPNEYFNARDIFQLALQVGADDEEMGEDTFYVVSSEGAIGMAVKYEYLTLWMFIPVFDEVIRERELKRLKIELDYDEAIESGRMSAEEAMAVFGPKYAELTGEKMEMPYSGEKNADAEASPKFCRQCGKPLRPGAKFCLNCGSKQ